GSTESRLRREATAMFFAFPESIDWLRALLPKEVLAFVWQALDVYARVWFWILIVSLLLLEWLRPANAAQRIFSWAMLQDFVWFNLDIGFQGLALPVVAGLTQLAYTRLAG